MKKELVSLQPKLEQAKVDNANMMKVQFLIVKICIDLSVYGEETQLWLSS